MRSTVNDAVLKPAKALVGFAKLVKDDPERQRQISTHGGLVSSKCGRGFRFDTESRAIAVEMTAAKAAKDKLKLARLRYEMQLHIHGYVGFITVFEASDATFVSKKGGKKKPAKTSAPKTDIPAKKGASKPQKIGKKK